MKAIVSEQILVENISGHIVFDSTLQLTLIVGVTADHQFNFDE